MSAFAPRLHCGHPLSMEEVREPATSDVVDDVAKGAGWDLAEPAVLRGRSEATGLAFPRELTRA